MRILEKGFGNCSLRTSTFICLVVVLVVNVCTILGILVGYASQASLIEKIIAIIFAGLWIAVFGYTLYTLHRDDLSMLNVALVALIIHIVLVILGLLVSFFSSIFSVSTYLFVFPYLVFEIYAAWILYSYSVEFNQPVSVHA